MGRYFLAVIIACNDSRWRAGCQPACVWQQREGATIIKADDASWANFCEVGLYELTAHAIRRGLAIGAIDMGDIWGVHRPLWQKLHASQDAEPQALLQLIVPHTQFTWDEANPTFYVSIKLRAIDPEIWLGGELRPLSQLDPAFAEHWQQYLRSKQGKWPMRVLPPAQSVGSAAADL